MSGRRTLVTILVAGMVGGFAYWGTQSYRGAQVRQQLDMARSELQAVLEAKISSNRQTHAQACFGIAEPLISESDPVGATAALFAIGVAPMARVTSDLAVPEADRVEEIPTSDLLLVTQALSDTGRIVPADQLLDLLLTRHDEHREEVLVLASAIRMNLGRDAEVIDYCDELIALNDAAASPYRMKATIHRLHGKWDHYVQALEGARRRSRQVEPSLQVELIEGYIRIGRFDDANHEFDDLKSKHPELIPRMPTIHAELLIKKGEFQEANQVLTDYLESDPSDTEALIIKGKLLVETGEFESAIEVLQKALKYDPSAQDAHFQIGQAYARLGQKDLANQHLAVHRKLLDSKVRMHKLEQQAANEPGNVAVRRELARIYAEIQLPELAAFWERAANTAAAKQ